MNHLLDRLRHFMEVHQIAQDEKLLVGVSGGADSVWLAYSLQLLGFRIGIAHVNYQLRGLDSDHDEAFVRDLASKWDVPIFVHHLGSPIEDKANLQMKARAIRYDFFEQVRTSQGYRYTALAHHQDDQVESLLMHLFKGGAERAMVGIPPKRGPYIRPLLGFTKAEIYQAITAYGIDFREDLSNFQPIYLRNKVRLALIPALRDLFPGFEQILLKKAEDYSKEQLFWSSFVKEWLEQSKRQSEEGGEELIFALLPEAGAIPLVLRRFMDDWEIYGPIRAEIQRLIASKSGKQILYQGLQIERTREGIAIYPTAMLGEKWIQGISLNVEVQTYAWFGRSISIVPAYQGELMFGEPNVFLLDQAKITPPLHIRTWREGDYMQPFGMKGRKKLSDIFIDEKYSYLRKRTSAVITDQEQVVALEGYRLADSVKITPQTEQIVRIEIIDH